MRTRPRSSRQATADCRLRISVLLVLIDFQNLISRIVSNRASSATAHAAAVTHDRPHFVMTIVGFAKTILRPSRVKSDAFRTFRSSGPKFYRNRAGATNHKTSTKKRRRTRITNTSIVGRLIGHSLGPLRDQTRPRACATARRDWTNRG